jgi:putative oxidoreductase
MRRTRIDTKWSQDVGRLAARLTVGGYLAGHGSQKLFGAFGGGGPEGTGEMFEHIGLAPGPGLAQMAGAAELGGGALTALGLLNPIGPIAVAGTMAVAAATAHRGKGPFAMTGGPELPVTNLASMAMLGAMGPGRLSLDHLLGVRLPRLVTAMVLAGAAATGAAMVARARGGARAGEEVRPPTGAEEPLVTDEEHHHPLAS